MFKKTNLTHLDENNVQSFHIHNITAKYISQSKKNKVASFV